MDRITLRPNEDPIEDLTSQQPLVSPAADPAGFAKSQVNLSYQNDDKRLAAFHGTTCLSFVYEGGIVVAVDSRASGGSFVFSGKVMKIIQFAPAMLGTMAGGAADCQYWLKEIGRQYRLHKFRYQEPMTVAAASKILANTLYEYKGYGLSIGSMICGFDTTGPHIFYVDNDGSRVAGKRFSVGSGSTHAYGVLDTCWKDNMTKEEACDLGRKAIVEATYRDSGSGGRVTVAHITEEGIEFVSQTDVFDLFKLNE